MQIFLAGGHEHVEPVIDILAPRATIIHESRCNLGETHRVTGPADVEDWRRAARELAQFIHDNTPGDYWEALAAEVKSLAEMDARDEQRSQVLINRS